MEEQNREAQPTNEQDQNIGQSSEEQTDAGQNSQEGGEETDYKALYEKEKEMRQGLVSKVKKLTETRQEEESSQKGKSSESSGSEDRLDKIELRQLDPNLTSDQMEDVLTIKKAKGLSDVSEAYQHPMVKAYINEQRQQTDKQQKTEQATPKTQNQSNVPSNEPQRLSRQNKDWLSKSPGRDNTEEMAKHLKERFGL